MFDSSDESDDNQSYASDWSESCWQDDENDPMSAREQLEQINNILSTLDDSGNLYGSDVSYGSSPPCELTDISQNSDLSGDEASNSSGMPASMQLNLAIDEGDFSMGEMIPFPDPACTIKYEDIMGNCSESEVSSLYSSSDRYESEESCESSQADDGNQSYRGTYTTELSDDDSSFYFNSDSYNDTPGLYELDCNPPALLNSQSPSGYATIIRAFSVWAEMEQLEKPPPPASKEVVDNLGTMEVTENSYQCPVCLRICEMGEILKLLPCSHAFHNECILPWLEKTNTCPLCRSEMPTDNEDYELFKSIEAGRQLRA